MQRNRHLKILLGATTDEAGVKAILLRHRKELVCGLDVVDGGAQWFEYNPHGQAV